MITFFSMHHATISRGWTALSPIFGANFASIKCSFWGLRLQPRWNLMIQSATNDEHPWYRMISKSYRDTSTLGIFRLTLIMTVRTAAPSPNRCVSTSLLAHSASNPPHLSSDLPVTFRPTKYLQMDQGLLHLYTSFFTKVMNKSLSMINDWFHYLSIPFTFNWLTLLQHISG